MGMDRNVVATDMDIKRLIASQGQRHQMADGPLVMEDSNRWPADMTSLIAKSQTLMHCVVTVR